MAALLPEPDYHCKDCGYTLKGLGLTGTCPECGCWFDKRRSQGLELPVSRQTEFEWLLARLRTIGLGILAVVLGVWSVYCLSEADLAAGLVSLIFTVITGLWAMTSYLYERD